MSHKNPIIHCHDNKVGTHVWYTPPDLLAKLGEFDLDPCTSSSRPWDTAKNHYTRAENGLLQRWFGRVWLNPPFDRNQVEEWLRRMGDHNDGIALLFARTDTNTFHNEVFARADSLLFLNKRLHFYNSLGHRAKTNCGAPCVLIGYGETNSDVLAQAGLRGKHFLLNRLGVVVVGYDRTWREVIRSIFVNVGDPMSVARVFELVCQVVPAKVSANPHAREKVRQILQQNFKRVAPATYATS